MTYQKYLEIDHAIVQAPYPLETIKNIIRLGTKDRVTYPFYKHGGRIQVKCMKTSLRVIIEFGDKDSDVGTLVFSVISDFSFPSSLSSRLVSVSSGKIDCGFPIADLGRQNNQQ